ncbi:hypothetical protein QZH41_012860 [Actinostola sp. cb2023]|nr:hypothetical protein QZH41_012860 [Actinostola sp. cb2023]
MATALAMMLAAAVVNAAAFTGGNILAHALLAGGSEAATAERKRHDLALEKYQAAMGAWEKRRTSLRDWEETREIARQKTLAGLRDADAALDLYARAHPVPPVGADPHWGSYYKPSKGQKTGEMVFRYTMLADELWIAMHCVTAAAKRDQVPGLLHLGWAANQCLEALWQIYLPPPRHVPRPRFDVSEPNEVHQADLLFLPHDRPGQGRKLYKYALTVVDVASRYKEAEPLATKEAKEVAAALERIYKRSPLTWPKLLQVDPGREFMGAVGPVLAKHGVSVRRGRVDIHRDQVIVERFNRTLSERLFGHQYAQEMLLLSQGDSRRSVEWVNRLPAVVAALNGEVTRLIVSEKLKKPENAIKAEHVAHKPSSVVSGRLVGLKEQRLPSDVGVRYLYAPGELEGGRKRATDPVWSLQVYRLGRTVIKPGEPVLYYLDVPALSATGPERGFVRKEFLVVPPETQLPVTE